MVEETYITRVFSDLESRCNRISVAVNRQRLRRQLNTSCPDVEYVLNTTLPPTLDEAQVAFISYNCAIFTAFRGGFSLEENVVRNSMLRADMDRLGLNYRPVDGCYKEAEMEHVVKEYCFFVVKPENLLAEEFFTHAYRLSEKYEQDCFLYKRAGFQKTAFLVATTDSGRQDLLGDIRFAGQFFEYVYDVGAWTACSDGRFAFVRKGMLQINTSNKKIKIGEGDIFDVDGYNPDCILVLRKESQKDLADACKAYDGTLPLVQHVFNNANSSPEYIHDVIFRCLKKIRDKKCKRIGFHSSISIDDSAIRGAAAVYDTIKLWAKRYDKKFEWIVIVDVYGDYGKVIDRRMLNKNNTYHYDKHKEQNKDQSEVGTSRPCSSYD